MLRYYDSVIHDGNGSVSQTKLAVQTLKDSYTHKCAKHGPRKRFLKQVVLRQRLSQRTNIVEMLGFCKRGEIHGTESLAYECVI